MKKMRFVLPLLAVLIVVAASAFTVVTQPKKTTVNNWYEYRGPSAQSQSDILNEQNYFLVTAPEGCESDQKICAILVPGTDEHPDGFSSTLEADLVDARTNHTVQTGYIEMKE